MATVVTREGRVTIPKRIREHLRITVGDSVQFALGADGEVVIRKAQRTAPADRVTNTCDRFERMRGSARTALTTDEIMMLLRGPRPEA